VARRQALKQSFRARYDGTALRPEESVDLQPNRRYEVTVVEMDQDDPQAGDNPMLSWLLDLAIDTGVPDLAAQHDHYLYGTPKR